MTSNFAFKLLMLFALNLSLVARADAPKARSWIMDRVSSLCGSLLSGRSAAHDSYEVMHRAEMLRLRDMIAMHKNSEEGLREQARYNCYAMTLQMYRAQRAGGTFDHAVLLLPEVLKVKQTIEARAEQTELFIVGTGGIKLFRDGHLKKFKAGQIVALRRDYQAVAVIQKFQNGLYYFDFVH